MTTSTNDLEKRLIELKKDVPTRGFKRHPIRLKSINELDPELQSPAVSALAAQEPLQSIIAFPPQIHRGWHYVPKQALLFRPTEVIHLMASIWPEQEPQVTHLKGSDLIYMNVKLILLYGLLEVAGQGDSTPTRLSVEFNNVVWDQLYPHLRQLLKASQPTCNASTDKATYSPAARQVSEKLPLKFSNGLWIFGLLPGEGLEELVYQPGTWKPLFLFRRKALTADSMLLLTTNYMVVIREELGFPYGWILTYIPRTSIVRIQNQRLNLWNELTVQLKRGDQTVEYKISLDEGSTLDWRLKWTRNNFLWEELPEAAVS
jgi:hypothetical protein